MADVTVPLGGWDYGNWGGGEWGNNSPAMPLATGQVGSVSVTGDALVSVTGVSGTTGLGSATVQAAASVSVTGVSATGIAGYTVWNVTVDLDGWGRGTWGQNAWNESLGLVATGAVGSVTVQEGAGVFPTGVAGTTALGNVVAVGDGAIDVLGNAATGQVGS